VPPPGARRELARAAVRIRPGTALVPLPLA
jgi:hypothetical protein